MFAFPSLGHMGLLFWEAESRLKREADNLSRNPHKKKKKCTHVMCRVEATARSSSGNYITNKSAALSLTFSPRCSCILTGPSLNQLRTVLSSPNSSAGHWASFMHSILPERAGSAKGSGRPRKKEKEWFLSSLMPSISWMRERGGTSMHWDSQRKCGLRVVVHQTPTMTVLSGRANEWWINPGSPLANWDDPANLAQRQVPKEYIPHTPRLTK